MKKIVILMILLLTFTVFGEKLNTDGKNNLDKMKGTWGNDFYQIVQRGNNDWYLGIYDVNYSTDSEYIWYKIKSYKNSVFVVQNYYTPETQVKDRNFYFAYDTKYRILVQVDRELNIIQKIPKKLNKPSN